MSAQSILSKVYYVVTSRFSWFQELSICIWSFCTADATCLLPCVASSAEAKSWGSQHKCIYLWVMIFAYVAALKIHFSKILSDWCTGELENSRFRVPQSFVSSLCSHVMFCTSDNQIWSLDQWRSVSISGSIVDLILWFQFWGFCRLNSDPSRTQ
jgi:hypothetical protein